MTADPLLARLRRNALIACVAMVLLALAFDPGRPAVALGVAGGGVLMAISYLAVAFTIETFLPRAGLDIGSRKRRKKRVFAGLLFCAHYALLGLAAYVMIARLRLHPVGLLGGVTSFVLAVAAEARRPRSSKP